MIDSSIIYVLFWMAASCAMILFNKAVLSSMEFPFPMFITTWHMLFATVLTQVLSRTTDMLPGVKEQKVNFTVLRNQILPVSVCFAFSLVLSNKVYIYLSVSYIQMLKAFTPVAVLALSALTGLEKVTFLEINIILIISVGVALTSLGEMQFSMVGFIFQALAIMFESGRLVMTNMFLKQLGLDSLSTLYYIAPMCGAVIGCACIAFELPNLPAEFLLSWRFWGILIANGMVAFSLNIASVMLIKHTSALTLTLAGVIKDILLVLLSLAIFKSPVTALQYLGYSVSLLALNLHKEYKKNSALFEATQTTQTQTAPSSPIAFISGSNGKSHATGGVEMGRVGDNADEEEEDAPLIAGSGSLIPGESLIPGRLISSL